MIRTGVDKLMAIPRRRILLERLTLNTLILIECPSLAVFKSGINEEVFKSGMMSF